MEQQVYFGIDGEWLTEMIREKTFYVPANDEDENEGWPLEKGIKMLTDCIPALDKETAIQILIGKKKLVGINELQLVDDDKFQSYLRWLTKYRKSGYIVDEARPYLPNWVLDEQQFFTLYDGHEAYYLSHGKYKPCEPGLFTEYGLISPKGEFYACEWASHAGAAYKILNQLGEIEGCYGGLDGEGKAKDILFSRGWVFVNVNGHQELFYSKYDRIEDMPQKQMNTCFDYQLWNQGEELK